MATYHILEGISPSAGSNAVVSLPGAAGQRHVIKFLKATYVTDDFHKPVPEAEGTVTITYDSPTTEERTGTFKVAGTGPIQLDGNPLELGGVEMPRVSGEELTITMTAPAGLVHRLRPAGVLARIRVVVTTYFP